MNDRHEPIDDQDVLAELRALGSRLPASPTDWEQPPAGLWERIAAEAGVPATSSTEEPSTEATDDDVVRPSEFPSAPTFAPTTTAPATSVPDQPTTPTAPATVTDLASRRRIPWVLGAVAAAVLLVVGIVAVVRKPAAEPAVLASVSLERLGDSGSGTAKLVDADGELRLRVDTADLDPGDGFLEVWMIDTEVSKLVSLGPVRPDGTYDLPPGLDPEQFPVIDVSVEHFDGDPTHSGDSVLRGQLTF